MKQILCVVDFTGSTARVLDVAGRIAAACGAHLYVIYPYRLIDYQHRGEVTSLKQKLESKAHEEFQGLINTLPHFSKISYEFHPEIGFVSDRIYSQVHRNAVDMIIMGQEQADPANDVKGFQLQNVIKHTQTPFVIVPSVIPVATETAGEPR